MVSAQLSLFDTAAVIKPTYKIGDRVKRRKKPFAASYVKKGDIVEIAEIHPLDFSIKFWNERSECWEYIYPDEIGRVVPDDSPTLVEVAVGESNCQHSETDVLPLVNAVGESNCPHSEIDSPTVVEVGVGESIVPDDSPTVVEVGVGESIAPRSETDYFLDPISIYTPRGTARGGKYYRLSYKDGGKVRQVHIRGGNIDSPIAQAKVAEVRSLLAAGIPPVQIATMLRNSGSKAPILSCN